jgi:hypothetical protein
MDSGNASGDKAARTWAMRVPGSTRKRILKRWNDDRSETSYVPVIPQLAVHMDDVEPRLVDEVTEVEVQDESDLGSVVPPGDSRPSTASKASWLFARPRRSSTAKSGSTQCVDEPESIIPEDSEVQTDEGEPKGPASRRNSKRSLSRRAMTIITLGKKSSTLREQG